jgi:DNA end-binding protein Ku
VATRPIWNGAITFGMVTIPVGLHTATEEKEIHFHQLHKDCGARVQYQKLCPVHEKVLKPAEIERGFEIAKGQYVIVTDEDLDTLPIPSKHAIEISSFAKAEEIDPLYFDKSYYVEPTEMGKKPLALLMRALVEKGVSALGKVTLRNRETLCLLRVAGEGVVLEILHWPDEIRPSIPAATGQTNVDDKQLKMAESFIDLLAEPFDPQKYHDEFRKALKDKIEAKSEGKLIAAAPEAQPAQVIDLMEALRASVEAAKGVRKSG